MASEPPVSAKAATAKARMNFVVMFVPVDLLRATIACCEHDGREGAARTL
jgi:hypothetical protein